MTETQPLDAWVEWKQRCALDLCAESTRSALRAFAWARFTSYARRYAYLTNLRMTDSIGVRAADAWHLLETRLVTQRLRSGKRAKDWLFARIAGSADDPLDVVQGGASLVMRDVVRDCLRLEFAPRNTVSPDAWAQDGGTQLSLEDLLPGGVDPRSEAEQREFDALAVRHAEAFFGAAADRERVALLAREQGLSLAHPAVVQAAGCSASSVHVAYRDFVETVASATKKEYAGEDAQVILLLSLAIVRSAMEQAGVWGKSEKGCVALFRIGERGVQA